MTTALCFYRKLNIEQRAGAWRIPALPSHQCRLHRQPTAPVAAAELRGAWTWPSRGDKVSRRPSSRQLGAKAWTEQSSACQQLQDERAGLLCRWLSLRAQSGGREGTGTSSCQCHLAGNSAQHLKLMPPREGHAAEAAGASLPAGLGCRFSPCSGT